MKILDSENIGLGSRILRNDQAFVNLKAENIGASRMWEEGISFAKEVLSIPDDEEKHKSLSELDDWKIWNLLIESTRHSNAPGLVLNIFKGLRNALIPLIGRLLNH